MNVLTNIDLLTVGIAVAANILIGFTAFISNTKSATHRLFFLQTVILSIWSSLNYISYQPLHNAELSLFLVRLVLFFAVPNSIVFLVLMHTFPSEKMKIKKRTLVYLFIVTLIVMVMTLTPLLFRGIVLNQVGAPTPIPNIGLIPFIIIAVLSLPIGIYYLLKNYFNSSGVEKTQLGYLIFGVVIMFSLIIPFNFIFPSILRNSNYIPLSAFFTFPFVIFTGYSIYRHKLFNVKVISTVFTTFLLSIATFLEVTFSSNFTEIIFRSSVFVLVLVFSILLLKGVLREVDQRERIQLLASDLSKANGEMEKANEKLKELDQLKSEFVSLATHQIRAPLTAIKGYVSLIEEGDYGPITNEVKGALDVVHKSTDNLVTIVGDFLDVSRIEQGRMKYDFKNFDVQQLAQQVVTELKPNVEKKGLALNYSFEKDKDYTIYGDLGKIKQIIGNIIDNSIKYTPVGQITVTVSKPSSSNVLVKISDTGVGIPPKVMPKLFQKFSRADNASDVNILGTGLGLYVAKQMIDAHHGRIWAESKGENKGSQFYIELPVKNS